jgi:phosphatidylserine decarboxylase
LAPRRLIAAAAAVAALCAIAYLFWRDIWFYRNPPRQPPAHEGVLAPADGTVVYVKRVEPGAEVIVIKEGVAATVRDILREDVPRAKLVVGIFMSPFDVHYNRAPVDARVDFVRRHPARGGNLHMGEMHLRSLLGIEPRYLGSMHILQNERAVTGFDGRYRGEPLYCYVVQIGALTVNGIDSYVAPGGKVVRGQTFGMIRIGSQVDLIVPWREGFEVMVKAGDIVRAGETIVVK